MMDTKRLRDELPAKTDRREFIQRRFEAASDPKDENMADRADKGQRCLKDFGMESLSRRGKLDP
jgi:hypothetical protein